MSTSNSTTADKLAWSQVRAQYLRLKPAERRRFRDLLRTAMRLDRALGELHLVLPAIEIRFYGLDIPESRSAGFRAHELAAAAHRWDQRQEFEDL